MIYILHSPGTILGAYGSSGAAIRALSTLTGAELSIDDARRLRAGIVLTVDGITAQPINLIRR